MNCVRTEIFCMTATLWPDAVTGRRTVPFAMIGMNTAFVRIQTTIPM